MKRERYTFPTKLFFTRQSTKSQAQTKPGTYSLGSDIGIDQGCPNLLQEGQLPAEFSFNVAPTDLP